MFLIGLLVMLGCAALAADLVVESNDAASMTAFTYGFNGFETGEIFVLGAIVGVLFAVGMALLAAGIGRMVQRRRERRVLRRESEDAEALRAANARLESELLAERTDSRSYPSDPDTVETTDTTTGRHRLRR
jgi:uncharacterized integral membrane protein